MNRRAVRYLIVALLITVATYFPVAGYQFVNWDDPDLLLQNPLLHPPTTAHLAEFWSAPYKGLYAPLSYTVWWIVQGISGASAGPATFHLINLATHLICVALVFAILRKFIPSLPAVLAGTLVFALHPMQVETIAWVSEFNNLLAAAFALASVLLLAKFANILSVPSTPLFLVRGGEGQGEGHLRSTENGPATFSAVSRRSEETIARFTQDLRLLITFASFLFLLALFSKPTAVVTPLIAALLICIFPHPQIRKMYIALILWLLASLAFSLVARNAQSAPGYTLLDRPKIALDAIAFYLIKFIAPFHLTPDFARTPARVIASTEAWLPIIIVATVVLILLFLLRRQRTFLFGLVIALVALLPILGLVPFAFQRYSTVADHFLYFPMFGLSLAIAAVVALLNRRLQVVATILLTISLAALSSMQLRVWRDTQTLAAHILTEDPQSTIGNKIVAAEFSRTGDPARSIPFYQAALFRNPDDAELHYNLANALAHSGRFKDAIYEYRRALSLPSDNFKVDALNNLGWAYAETGQSDLAAEQFQKVLQIQPDNSNARRNLQALGAPNVPTP